MNISQSPGGEDRDRAGNTAPVTPDATSAVRYMAQPNPTNRAELLPTLNSAVDAVMPPASCGCGSSVKAMRRTVQSMFS